MSDLNLKAVSVAANLSTNTAFTQNIMALAGALTDSDKANALTSLVGDVIASGSLGALGVVSGSDATFLSTVNGLVLLGQIVGPFGVSVVLSVWDGYSRTGKIDVVATGNGVVTIK